MISPPTWVKRVLNEVSASAPGAQSLTRVTTRLEPFLIAHSAIVQACGAMMKPARTKYGDLVVVIEAPELMHEGRLLGFGDELRHRERRRRDAHADDVDLVVDDHLLNDAPGIVGNAGIVADDDLDLAAGDAVAVLLLIDLERRR